ncbi:thioredoxin family protein [Pseudomonas orientalis]|nr:thioredoxin family protein [Pseudomonas orientalis]MDF2793150.1 hypothetical protein [Pseudomonas orientalis]
MHHRPSVGKKRWPREVTMGIAKDAIATNEQYQSIVRSAPIVFILFVSETCPGCGPAAEHFEAVARHYKTVKCLVVDIAKTPRLPGVRATPTLVPHVNGKVKEFIEGFGPPATQKQTLEGIFRRALKEAQGIPASPGAHAPQPPSTANLHVPGDRPPRAGDQAGS